MARFSEAEVIHVDFQTGEVLDIDDQEVSKLWDEYHEAIANGGVDLPLVEEGFAALYAAMGAAIWVTNA